MDEFGVRHTGSIHEGMKFINDKKELELVKEFELPAQLIQLCGQIFGIMKGQQERRRDCVRISEHQASL